MHRRASSSYGATIAPVGQASRHARQRAAVRRRRCRRRQRQVGVDLAQEEPGSLPREEQRVLAAPAGAGPGGERDFHHRRAVREHAMAEVADLVGDARGESREPLPHHLVVVAAEGVARHVGARAVGEHGGGIARARREVVEARRDDADGSRNQLGRPRPADAVPGHIIHRAVPARREPVHEPGFLRAEIGVGNAHRTEAEFASPRDDAGRERAPVVIVARPTLHRAKPNPFR